MSPVGASRHFAALRSLGPLWGIADIEYDALRSLQQQPQIFSYQISSISAQTADTIIFRHHPQSRVIEIILKSLSSLMSYCPPQLQLASSTSK